MERVPNYPAIALRYAEAVASRRLPTNRLLVLAAQRYLDMLEMAKSPGCEFYFSPEHLIDYCRFGERLCHFESGNWENRQLDADGNPDPKIILEPFEIWIEANAQGFRRRSNGTRLITTVLELVPRKSSKSLRAARAALYDLCCSGTKGAEIPVAAMSAKQADDTLFGDITKLVNSEANADLKEHFNIETTKDEVRSGDGRIFKVSGQGERLDGLNPSLALFDEAHAGSALVYKVIESAFGARPGQQMRVISTAGQRPEGPAFDLVKQAKLILESGIENFSFFAAIYTLDPEDYQHPETKLIMWEKLLTSEELIMKCNPMYGISLDAVLIKEAVKKGNRQSPTDRGEIARTRFNIWSSAGVALIDPTQWAACYDKNLDLDMFAGERCWIGVDLAQYHDMCALILIFELPNDCLAIFGQFYLPEDSETAMNPDIVDHIHMWRDQGKLYLTEGVLADHDFVRGHVEDFCDMFDIQVIACDPAQAHNTVKHLYDGNKPVMVFPNSAATMTAPTDDLLGRIASRRIIHDGNPVLSWHIQNVHGERQGNGTIMPRKEKKDSHRKIDGFVAAAFANGCRMNPEIAKTVGEDKPQQNLDDSRGIIGADRILGESHV